jgi:predicted RNase H-like HicB family nuclease
MRPYIAIVSKDRESAYGVAFPDAPGCFSAADDLDTLFAQASEALAGWLESMREAGHTIDMPRDLSDLKADPALAEDFAEAALVIAVPAPADDPITRAA